MARRDSEGGLSRRAALATVLGAPMAAWSLMTPAAARGGAFAERSCREAIPAHELGIVPDGGMDQSAALERALRHAATLGRALRLPPGIVVAGELDLDVPVHLLGGETSRLECRAGARWLLRVRGAPQLLLDGVFMSGHGQARADGQEDGTGLVKAENVRDARVINCTVDGAGGHGLHLVGCGGVVRGNHLQGVAESGVFALDCTDMRIVHNDVMDCGNGGILVWQSAKRHDGALVAHNRIRRIRADAGGTGQNGNGVNVFRGSGVQVVENDIADCAFSAVRDNSGDDVIIARNLCRRLGEVAIFVEFTFVNAQVANNLVEGAAAGISITNMKEGGRRAVVSGNVLRDLKPVRGLPGEEGFGIGAEADTTVVGNVVERAAKYAIALGWGKYLRNVVATGNVVRESPVGVAVSVVKGVGRAVVAANVFDGVRIGVAGYDHDRRVTGELLSARQPPRHLVLNANSLP